MAKQASEEFWDIVVNAGALVQTCRCNRTFFGTDGHYEDGEREEYEKGESKNPDKYISIDGSSHSGHVDGEVFVYECEGCRERLAKYEGFIWSHRFLIADYLSRRAENQLEDAKRDGAFAALAASANRWHELAKSKIRKNDERSIQMGFNDEG